MLDNFTKVAQFALQEGSVACLVNENVDKYERVSLVYMMVVNDKIKYIGKTIQGLIRPLSYHKNKVMIDVNKGINESCKAGLSVDIYCRMFYDKLEFEGLELDICEAYEQALISKYKPEWNNHIR
jgi:hypothetical protein